MALNIGNNLSSLTAQYLRNQTPSSLNNSLQRLSSGLKVNSAADGPAALVISQQNQAQITGLNAAITNTFKAVNVAQTADGGLSQVNTLLQTIRGLALNSARTPTTDTTALAANQAQIANAVAAISNIVQTTQASGTNLFATAGTAGASSSPSTVPANTNPTASTFSIVDYAKAIAAYTKQPVADLTNLSTVDVTSSAGANNAIAAVDKAIGDVNTARGQIGAVQSNTLSAAQNNLATSLQNTTGTPATTPSTDFAAATANFTQQNVLLQSGAQSLKTSQQTSQVILSLLQAL